MKAEYGAFLGRSLSVASSFTENVRHRDGMTRKEGTWR